MIIYETLAVAFLLTTPIVAHLLVDLFNLRVFGLNTADVALLFFASQLILVSKTFLTHSLLPHYLAIMSCLAIIICSWILHQKQGFSYRRFLKLYWRVGFFVTLASYIGLIILIFVPNNF